ncbi:hypothetical protein ABZ892_21075 [Streptomyces sp. NPDC046924]
MLATVLPVEAPTRPGGLPSRPRDSRRPRLLGEWHGPAAPADPAVAG